MLKNGGESLIDFIGGLPSYKGLKIIGLIISDFLAKDANNHHAYMNSRRTVLELYGKIEEGDPRYRMPDDDNQGKVKYDPTRDTPQHDPNNLHNNWIDPATDGGILEGPIG